MDETVYFLFYNHNYMHADLYKIIGNKTELSVLLVIALIYYHDKRASIKIIKNQFPI